jgi:hypothetical protein
MKTIDDVTFDIECEFGMMGRIYLDNGYGLYVTEKRLDEVYAEYEIVFLHKINGEAWTIDMDSNMLAISETNHVIVNSAEAVNSYIQQIEAIPAPPKQEQAISEIIGSSGSSGSSGSEGI